MRMPPVEYHAAVTVAKQQHAQGWVLGFWFSAALFAPWWALGVAVVAGLLLMRWNKGRLQ